MIGLARRHVLKGAAAGAGLGLLYPAALLAAEDDPYLRLVHPELRGMARAMAAMAKSSKPWSSATLAENRASMARFAIPFRGDVPVEKRMVPGAAGQPEVPVYVANARPGEALPAVLDVHGGGFIGGDAKGDVRQLQDMCAALGVVGMTVDYRLAPEVTCRGSIEDNYAALKWLHGNAAALGADPARIALHGGSAGGGHAALLALTARDRGEVPLAFQCLIYPMLDDRTGSSRPGPAHVGKLVWTAESNRFGWESFLGHKPGGRLAPKGAVPARVDDLTGLPPTFIGVGTLDLFHDEDVEYARRLNDAGTPCELIVVPGAFHGFDMVRWMDPKSRLGAWFEAAKLDALRRGLGLPAA